MAEMPGVRSFLLTCLLCGIAPSFAAQFGPPPADPIPPRLAAVPKLPTDQQLEAAHARIGKIDIYPINVFDLSTPGDNNWLYRAADKLHLTTRQAAIRAMLLFRSGDLYSRKLLDESARTMRQNSSFVREPVIRPIAYHDGVVDIQVITHDVWTLEPGIDFSRAGGANAFGFEIADANFLGTGKFLDVGHSENVDRRTDFVNWTDPNIAYTHWTDALQYDKNSDGTNWVASVARPFYSLETPYDVGIDVSNDHSVVPRYRLGQRYDDYDNDWIAADLYAGKALLIDDAWTDRLLIGWRVDDNEFSKAPDYALLAPLPQDRDLSYPFVRLQWTRNNYVTMDNLALIARTEDVHLGLDASIGMGYTMPAFGGDRHAFLADSELADIFAFGSTQQLLLNGRLSARFEEEAMRDGIAIGSANYYLATSDHTRFYMNLSGDIGHNLDGDHYFDLGGDDGLRGYPLRYQNGNQLALFTVEERLYSNWFPFRLFNVGAAGFFDMGRTWGTPLVATPQLGLLKDFGAGLRLGNARSSFGSVIHIDVAVPLNRAYGISRVQFLVTTQQSY